MIKSIIENQLKSGNEEMTLSDFTYLAKSGETNLIERKSIKLINKEKTTDLKKKISKLISSFSNYIGGCILFGVDDSGNIEDGIENKLGHGSVKEWLEDIVFTSCTPLIKDFSIKKIKIKEKCLFIIIIDESINSPHQANDNKYYYRIDGKSKPIDGILVRDIFNRLEYSDLDIEFNISPYNDNAFTNAKAIFSINIKNISNVPAEKVCVLMKLSQSIINNSMHSRNGNFEKDNGQFNIDIVYPGLLHDIVGREKIKLTEFSELNCSFQIVAKNMHLKKINYKIIKNQKSFIVFKI